MSELTLHSPTMMDYPDGHRGMVGPGIIEVNEQGQVLGMRGFTPIMSVAPPVESEAAQDTAATPEGTPEPLQVIIEGDSEPMEVASGATSEPVEEVPTQEAGSPPLA